MEWLREQCISAKRARTGFAAENAVWFTLALMIGTLISLAEYHLNDGFRWVDPSVVPTVKQKEYDAVRQAIETTHRMPTGAARLRIIELVYWKGTHTVEGAAMKAGYSTDRGKQMHGEFVRLVAKCYGYDL